MFKVFRTIKIQLLLIFLLFSLINAVVSVYGLYIYKKGESNNGFKNFVHDISFKILQLNKLQYQFITYESHNNNFYQTNKSDYIENHNELFDEVVADIINIRNIDKDIVIPERDLLKLKIELKNYIKDYSELITRIQERGFRDYGLEGVMRDYIHEAEQYKDSIDMAMLLMIRRNEKDYILRKDSIYIVKHSQNLFLLKEGIHKSNRLSDSGKIHLIYLLDKYQESFHDWVKVDLLIGTHNHKGLTEKMRKHNLVLSDLIEEILELTDEKNEELENNNKAILIGSIVVSTLLSILLAWYLSRSITRPIIELNGAMTGIVNNNFSSASRLPSFSFNNEIGTLFDNFHRMIRQMLLYISELEKNRNILKANEKKFRALIENSNDAIALTDSTGKIIYASSSTKRIIGFSFEELEGKNTAELVHPEDSDSLLSQFVSVLNSPGKTFYFQFRILHKDGNWIWVDAYSTNLLSEPNINGIITNYHDVTERKINELKIQEQNHELHQINQELDRFVYSASHDLKAPLTSILGMVKVARLERDVLDKLKYLDMAEVNVKKLLNVIKDLSNFSRNKRMEVEKENIDLLSTINECIDSYSFINNFNKIKFEVYVTPNVPYYSDRLRIKTLFGNLISNAVIYHNVNQEYSYVSITVHCDFKNVYISVKDNGQGIDPAYHVKIFDMFYRASTDSIGSGLGLYIVRGIIEKLSGNINLISSPGVGTEFIISIPNLHDSAKETSMNVSEFIHS